MDWILPSCFLWMIFIGLMVSNSIHGICIHEISNFYEKGGGPEGCTGNQESTRKATPEQKQVFAELVDMITRFGMEHTQAEA